jgi:hypothetical protein
MFSSSHFYHRIIRKMVVAFGTLFNDIRLVRYNRAGTIEIERIIVPLQYAQKEKFYQRITQDPELTKEVQLTLPRMSFELTNVTYDPLRKRNLFSESFSAESATTVKALRTTPYDFEFTLNIYVRNAEDGTQIVEQILPFFNPDYTMTIDFLGLADQKTDIPFILQSVNQTVEDTGGPDPIRLITWSLVFVAKGYMYGPIVSREIIRKVTANTFNGIFNSDNQRLITVSNTGGSGTFQTGELVFEGEKLDSANVTAFVYSWNPTSNNLVVTDVNGIIKTGRYITGVVSNASYNIASFGTNEAQLSKLTVQPAPNTATPNTAFGFDQTVQDFPDIT